MSHSSSSHAAHTITKTGHTASLSRQPTQDYEEDPSEHEVSSERSTSIHSPTLTPTLVPSLSIRQGPPFRQTTRMRVISPTMVNFGSRPQETPAREVSPHPSLISTYHIGGPSSTDPNVTARVSDRYSWQHLMEHPRYPTGPRPDINRMQYLCVEVQDCKIRVEHQATLLFEMFDIVRRLTHQITIAIYTTEREIVIGRRSWNTRSTNNEDQPNDLDGMVARQLNAALPNLEFYGNEGAVGLLSWIEGMESKLHINKCSDNSKVEYTTCLLQEYFPKSEVQKLESEFWNHTMVSSDIDKYTTRFHKLAKLVPHMVTPEDKRIDCYIWGLALEIRGMVTSANPSSIQSVVVLANRLTNDTIRSRVWKKDNVRNKRREENQSRNQGGGNLDKRQWFARNYGMATQGPNQYVGPHQKCAKCRLHHTRNCPVCRKYHLRNTCPKLNKALGQGRNRLNPALAIEGNIDRRNNDNQTHGRAFIIGANEACQNL
ncbi:hypothetical protein Tco_1191763 [Tanacetum coccineum]